MRKQAECDLYNLLKASAHLGHETALVTDAGVATFRPEIAAILLGIPQKRMYAWLIKWAAKGWWEYGVSLRSGWLTDSAPQRLAP